jgi:hypothetical protein
MRAGVARLDEKSRRDTGGIDEAIGALIGLALREGGRRCGKHEACDEEKVNHGSL